MSGRRKKSNKGHASRPMDRARAAVTRALPPPEPPAEDNSPLARLPGESDDEYKAFRVWVEIGPSRTYGMTAMQTGFAQGVIARWSSQRQWPKRIKGFVEEERDHAASLMEENRVALIRTIAADYDEVIGAAKSRLEMSECLDSPGGDPRFLALWLQALRDKRKAFGIDALPLHDVLRGLTQQQGDGKVSRELVMAYRETIAQQGPPPLEDLEREIVETDGTET